MDQQQELSYVSAPCGSGKTYSAILHIATFGELLKKRTIIVSPSIALSQQTYQLLRSMGVENAHLINSDSTSSVQADILKTIKENFYRPNLVLCITYAAFTLLPYIPRKEAFDLIVDDIFNADSYFEPSLPHNAKLLSDHLEVEEVKYKPSLYKVSAKPSMASILAHQQDDVDDAFIEIFKMLDRGYDVWVSAEQWTKIVQDGSITKDKDVNLSYGNRKNKMYFLGLISASKFLGFHRTIFLGANLENSILFKHWSDNKNIVWKKHEQIYNHLRYNDYKHISSLVRLSYINRHKYSKFQRDQKMSEKYKTYGDAIDHYASVHFSNRPYLYVANNDHEIENNAEHDERRKRMPVCSNGLNAYDSYKAIYFGPALRRSPMHSWMLQELGFDQAFVDRATMHEAAHQAIMRSALRNPLNKEEVEVLVVDKDTAESLARLFPGCTIQEAGEAVRKVKDNTLTKAGEKHRERVRSLLIAKGLQKFYTYEIGENDEIGEDDDLAPTETLSACKSTLNTDKSCFFLKRVKSRHFGPDLNFSVLDNIHVKEIAEMPVGSLMECKAFLKSLSREEIKRKADYQLISATKYEEPRPEDETTRGLQQALFSGLLIFDIDNGDLTPDQFIEIMRPYKLAYSICNSFSRTPEKPNKFRVFVYLRSPVDDHDYKLIWDSFVKIFASAGYYTDNPKLQKERKEKWENYKTSGIDRTKRHIASFYYPPSTNINQREMAFFYSYNCDRARDMEKNALDPVEWLKVLPERTKLDPLEYNASSAPRTTIAATNKEERLQTALDRYNSAPEGSRHHEGYRLVCALLAIEDGDESNIRTHLNRAYSFDYHKLNDRIRSAREWYQSR